MTGWQIDVDDHVFVVHVIPKIHPDFCLQNLKKVWKKVLTSMRLGMWEPCREMGDEWPDDWRLVDGLGWEAAGCLLGC